MNDNQPTYFRRFDPNLATLIALLDLPWKERRTARKELFLSDHQITYSYGNRTGFAPEYRAEPMSGHPVVADLMKLVNRNLGTSLNACFLNRYDDEKNHLGWHADDFEGMDRSSPIAVVSYGAEREIWWKPKMENCPHCNWTGRGMGDCGREGCDGGIRPTRGNIPDSQKRLLEHGSMWVMPVGFQDTHLHRIPKHDRPCGVRVSLTFRRFLVNE